MTRVREHRRAGRRWSVLTAAILRDLTAGIPGAFASDDERRAAWGAFRERFLSAAAPGSRPAAFWDYEGPPALRGLAATLEALDALDEARLRYLAAHDLLTDDELRKLEEWSTGPQGWAWAPKAAIVREERARWAR